jgi:hypothetical protein
VVEKKTVLPHPHLRDTALHAVHLPTKGASLVTGALVVGAVVGGSAGYRVGNAISGRHDGRARARTAGG